MHAENMSERSSAATAVSEMETGSLAKSDIPTPALVLDLDAFEFNLHRVAEQCRRTSCGFRPHAKTHKCPTIAQRQVAAGALGISVATVPEAEAMVAAGLRGVLLTSPIVEPNKIARMVQMAQREGTVMLAVGHERQVQLLAEAADATRTNIELLVDLDIGDRRTGVASPEAVLELARHIGQHKRLRVRGVQAYAGHASHSVGFDERQRVSREAMGRAVAASALLREAGFDAPIVSGGSTGTYNIDSEISGVTELQVGSYVFMDVDYRRIGGKDGNPIYSDFRPSLTVLTTVVSTTYTDRVTVDAGTKAVDTSVSHRPECKTDPGLLYGRAGDEFGSVTAGSGAKLPRIGDRLEFIVPHCDPNVNLYDRIYAVRGEKVEGIWPVAARRELGAAGA